MSNPCPACRTPAPARGYKIVWNPHNKPFNVEGKRSTRCGCGAYWYHYTDQKIEMRSHRGRPRLGKTHKRSPEAKVRRNAHKKNRSKSGRYRYQHYDILYNVLDIGQVPVGKMLYHKARYEKAGRPWVERPLPWGFKLKAEKKFLLPLPVVEALNKIYSNICLVPRPKKAARRTPRARTRSQNIENLNKLISELEAKSVTMARSGKAKPLYDAVMRRYNLLNQVLQEEIALRDRRDYAENPSIRKEYGTEDQYVNRIYGSRASTSSIFVRYE